MDDSVNNGYGNIVVKEKLMPAGEVFVRAYSGERDHRFWFKVITFTRIRNLISSQ